MGRVLFVTRMGVCEEIGVVRGARDSMKRMPMGRSEVEGMERVDSSWGVLVVDCQG